MRTSLGQQSSSWAHSKIVRCFGTESCAQRKAVRLTPKDYQLESLFRPKFLFIPARKKVKEGVTNSQLHKNVQEAFQQPSISSALISPLQLERTSKRQKAKRLKVNLQITRRLGALVVQSRFFLAPSSQNSGQAVKGLHLYILRQVVKKLVVIA